ncbi:MAG: Calx-beta domain-containing protein [Roseibacillus sp.]
MKTPPSFLACALLATAIFSGTSWAGSISGNVVSIEATIAVTAEPAPNIRVIPGQFTIRRRGDTTDALPIWILYDGTASPNSDYRALPATVTFEPGEDTIILSVEAIDDNVVERDETVIARVEDGTLLPIPLFEVDRGHERAVVTIRDSDRPTDPPTVVSIEATMPVTAEPGPNILVVPGEFTIRRHGDLRAHDPALTVYLSYGGTATPGADYARLPERVEFAPGEDTVTLKVLGVDDDEVEEAETVIASLRPSTIGAVTDYQIDPNRARATVTINDTDRGDEGSVVSIKATRRIAEETAAPLRRINLVGEFTVSRTGSTLHAQPAWIHVSGTATARSDYEAIASLVTIPAGERSVSFPVTALFDNVPEGIETVIATLSECPPFGSLAPCFFFQVDPASASDTVFIRESGLSVATLHLTEPASGDQFVAGETIRLEAVAIHLESYISRVEFWAGDTRIGESEILFLVAPDPGTPITHQFEWQRGPAGTHVLTARATIPDANTPRGGTPIVSSPVRITVGEGGGNQAPRVAIASPSSGDQFPAGDPIIIVIEARDPDGYIPHVEFFADGLQIGELNISFLVEPPPGQTQRFTFTWEHPMPGRHALTARVTDNDGESSDSSPVEITVIPRDSRAIVNVVARDALAVEPGPNGTMNTAIFRIRRHGSTAGELVILYELGGSAENGVDYELLPGRAVIPDGSASIDVTVVPLADKLREGGESVKLGIVPDSTYLVDFPHAARAVIHDQPLDDPDRPRCIPLAGGLFHLCFPAPPGICFRVEVTSNLRDWTTVFCLLSIDGTIHFVGERVPGLPHRFFRIAEEPDGLRGE